MLPYQYQKTNYPITFPTRRIPIIAIVRNKDTGSSGDHLSAYDNSGLICLLGIVKGTENTSISFHVKGSSIVDTHRSAFMLSAIASPSTPRS